MHMISSNTCETHRPPNPWVVLSDPLEVDQASEHPSQHFMEEIASSKVPLVPLDVG